MAKCGRHLEDIHESMNIMNHNQRQIQGGDRFIANEKSNANVISPSPPTKKRKVQMALMFNSTQTVGNSAPSSQVQRITLELKGLTISTLFFSWYSNQMYVRGDGMSQDQQDMMNLLAKAICYCKVFLPTETVIKPSPAIITAHPDWSSEIRALGIKAE